MSLLRFAHVLAVRGDAQTATRLLSCTDALGQEITGNFAWMSRLTDETLASLHDQLDADAFAVAWEQGRTMTLADGVALALSAAEPATGG
jgi:hypothetical protein